MAIKCSYCHGTHVTLADARTCGENVMKLRLLMRETEPKAVVVDLDAYRRRREELASEARTRQPTNLAGIRRAREALRDARRN
jgi:PHD/YefM family antitoxin component YafN of YafNO toxin-antitoxin module